MTTFTYRATVPPTADIEAATRMVLRDALRRTEGLVVSDVSTSESVLPEGSMEPVDCSLAMARECGIAVGSVLITVTGVTRLS